MNRDAYRVFPCTERKKGYKFVVRGRINGQYVRKYFALKTDAEVWAEIKNIETSNQGTEHSSFSTTLRLQAQTAADLLAPHDVTLLEAVKIALPIIEARTKSITVEAALTRFFTDYRLHGGPKKAVVSAS